MSNFQCHALSIACYDNHTTKAGLQRETFMTTRLAKIFNTVYFNQQGKAFQNKCAVRRQNYWLWEPKNLVCDNLALWELKPSWLSAEVGMAAP